MTTQNDDEDEDAASEAVPQPTPEDQNIPMSNSSMSSGSISDRPHHSSSTQAQGTKKKSTPRRFFPDTDMGSFFRSKRRVQNIDWKLAEAVKQVEHLQLDGMTTSPGAIQGNKNSGGGGGSYEPPITE